MTDCCRASFFWYQTGIVELYPINHFELWVASWAGVMYESETHLHTSGGRDLGFKSESTRTDSGL